MTVISIAILIYLLAGAVFAIAFVAKGCAALDAGAKSSSVGFRLMIFPASILLWPYLLLRWLGVAK